VIDGWQGGTSVTSDTTKRPSTRPRSRRGEGAQLRVELLDAAEALLAGSDRAEDVSLREVAAIVGVTAPAIYRHFEDKDALLLAVVERRFADFRERISEAAMAHRDPFDGLREAGFTYCRFAIEHPAHYRVLFGPIGEMEGLGLPPDTPHSGHPGVTSMAILVFQCQRCLDSGPGGAELEATHIAAEAWSLLHGFVDLCHCRPGFPWPSTEVVVGGWVERLRHAVMVP
jgi:AcrR family transcriptional regulator